MVYGTWTRSMKRDCQRLVNMCINIHFPNVVDWRKMFCWTAINQIEIHPWCQQKEIVSYCQTKGIIVQAYCPLIRGAKMGNSTLVSLISHTCFLPESSQGWRYWRCIHFRLIYRKLSRKPLLRFFFVGAYKKAWCLYLSLIHLLESVSGGILCFASVSRAFRWMLMRIEENADIYDFELNKEMMAKLDELEQGKEGACSWNPVDSPWGGYRIACFVCIHTKYNKPNQL